LSSFRMGEKKREFPWRFGGQAKGKSTMSAPSAGKTAGISGTQEKDLCNAFWRSLPAHNEQKSVTGSSFPGREKGKRGGGGRKFSWGREKKKGEGRQMKKTKGQTGSTKHKQKPRKPVISLTKRKPANPEKKGKEKIGGKA